LSAGACAGGCASSLTTAGGGAGGGAATRSALATDYIVAIASTLHIPHLGTNIDILNVIITVSIDFITKVLINVRNKTNIVGCEDLVIIDNCLGTRSCCQTEDVDIG
jgi:hypothetical protein